MLLAVALLAACTSSRQPRPIKAETSAEIDTAVREMREATLQQAARTAPTPTGR
jgi:hypothetical protein